MDLRAVLPGCLLALALPACGSGSTQTNPDAGDGAAGVDAGGRDGATFADAGQPDVAPVDPGTGPVDPTEMPPPAGTVACEAAAGGHCYYVAPGGSDANPGTFEQPFGTFEPALVRVMPGDVIYARGGLYGAANTMVTHTEVDFDHSGANYTGTCSHGLNSGGMCWWDYRGYLGLSDYRDNSASNTPIRAIASGTATAPITVRNYPGERPVLQQSGFDDSAAVYVLGKSFWTVRGFEIAGGGINLEGRPNNGSTHDFTIASNDIHHRPAYERDNNGLVFIERADGAPAYNIFVRNNHLHDMYIVGMEGSLDGGIQQHLGAVTTMSCEVYTNDLNCGGTGRVEITGNRIDHMPQVFFFKNPMPGPILIEGNVITTFGTLGGQASEDLTMRNNLLVGPEGFNRGGGDQGVAGVIDGNNGRYEHNTFVNVNFVYRSTGSRDNQFTDNVAFGLPGTVSGANYDSHAFLELGDEFSMYESDDPAQSVVQGWSASGNCLVSPSADFAYLKRFSLTTLTHYTLAQAQQTFGLDLDAVVVTTADPAMIFVNPAQQDYHVRADGPCAGKGATVP